ncbi:hypothetical protein KFL_003540140 [Klebsormidium nitens]|uniref:Selenoprotein O n=1 Tax=Klebsormidium nitens TaxID=105231 RepID=A0A1Y1IEC0_KLENI|nr:hypothetical protein KFL_003540140 [Klebsormidium nitens]|eukprot:GAQ87461.1 hypothetical protein KFL_003540140 [Klebsormidium nitens]
MACSAALGGSGLFTASLQRACGAIPLQSTRSSFLYCPALLFRNNLPCSSCRPLAGIASAKHDPILHQFANKRDVRSSAVSSEAAPLVAMGVETDQHGPGETLRKLEELEWDNSFVRELPADPSRNGPIRQVRKALFSYVEPQADVKEPAMVAYSDDAAKELLGLDPEELERPEAPLIFSGAARMEGSVTYAQNYGGHQFGSWAGQLGDGRAITLGELLNPRGERWELQLKGAGKTPYSRHADGQAVLRSSVREFLCSETMHGLGVPTTRALTLVTTGRGVWRDMFYDGDPKQEPGAVVCRIAPSFVRFGTFQLPASRGEAERPLVKQLADYVIKHHYPHLERGEAAERDAGAEASSSGEGAPAGGYNKYGALFKEVAERTARLAAKWQGVGFAHGVLNTDNMSILGLTIDYGPFAFVDAFDDQFTPNTSDPTRRYAFGNQPDVILWNMVQLANAFIEGELLTTPEAQELLPAYPLAFGTEYRALMAAKMGLPEYDADLTTTMFQLMKRDSVDFTNHFRALGDVTTGLDEQSASEEELLAPLEGVLGRSEKRSDWADWMRAYLGKLKDAGDSDSDRKKAMNRVNPRYVLRNYMLQNAIAAAETGDYGEVRTLLRLMRTPYEDQPGMERYAALPPSWSTKRGVCQLSCSS